MNEKTKPNQTNQLTKQKQTKLNKIKQPTSYNK